MKRARNHAQHQSHVRPPRHRFRRRAVTIAALLGAALGLAAPAYSYWSATSTGSAVRADATTLPAPRLTATAVTATSTTLAWTQPFQPTGYDLAQSPATLTGCTAHPATSATGCTASGLTPNTAYTFSLSAAMYNWRSPATLTTTTPQQTTTTTITSTTPKTGPAGTNFTATAKVAGNSNFGMPAGNLTFDLFPTSNCSGPAALTTPPQPLTNNTATGSLQPPVGTYYWQATYTPTDTYNTPSTSACSTAVTVTPTGGSFFATGPGVTVDHDEDGVVVNYPRGTSAGDLVLLVLLDNANHPSTIGSSGWADIDHSTDDSRMGLQSWWHTAGTETSVTIEHLHTSGNVHGASAWVTTYKNMASPTLVNYSSGDTNSTSGTATPTSLTTNTANTTVISLMGTNNSTALSLSTVRNFDLRTSQSSFSPDHAFGVADRFVTVAGTINPPTWQGRIGQSSQWAYTTVAFTSSP